EGKDGLIQVCPSPKIIIVISPHVDLGTNWSRSEQGAGEENGERQRCKSRNRHLTCWRRLPARRWHRGVPLARRLARRRLAQARLLSPNAPSPIASGGEYQVQFGFGASLSPTPSGSVGTTKPFAEKHVVDEHAGDAAIRAPGCEPPDIPG